MDRHNCTDTIPGAALSSALSLSWQGWLEDGKRLFVREMKQVLTTVRLWKQRIRVRRQLAKLDERLLRDVGLSPLQVRLEAEKPFWRD